VKRLLAGRGSGKWFLLPVHLFGHSMNLRELKDTADRFEVTLIEDCAQSIDAGSEGCPTGTAGQAAATSFYPTKNLGCMGDGGAVLTDSDIYAAAARQCRDYGQSRKYVHSSVGMNSRLDELQAAILSDAMLPRLNQFTARRRQIAKVYRDHIKHPKIAIPAAPPGSDSSYHLFPVLTVVDRESLREHLRSENIDSAVHYPTLIPSQPAMKDQPFEQADDLAVARSFAASEVSLPIHPFLSDAEVERVIDACNSW